MLLFGAAQTSKNNASSNSEFMLVNYWTERSPAVPPTLLRTSDWMYPTTTDEMLSSFIMIEILSSSDGASPIFDYRYALSGRLRSVRQSPQKIIEQGALWDTLVRLTNTSTRLRWAVSTNWRIIWLISSIYDLRRTPSLIFMIANTGKIT